MMMMTIRQGKKRAMDVAMLSFSLLCCILHSHGVNGREADERSKFLYIHNPAAHEIVWEYEPHMHAPHFVIEDRTELLSDFAQHIAQTNVTEANVRPFFLRDEYPIQRIVEYYSPWCGACQNFVPRYIAVAKEILSRLPPYHLEFYAVSCSEHHQLCQEENIRQYPTTRAFKPYSKDYLEFKSFTVQSISDTLGLDLQQAPAADSNSPPKSSPSSDANPTTDDSPAHHEKADEAITAAVEEDEENMKTLDILGATNDVYRHTRTDVYRDAALSFTYALENHIFVNGQKELSLEQAKALSEWLDLLYWSLPPTWMVHALINDLRRNIDRIVKSKAVLLTIVKNHRGVVHDNKQHTMQWSQGCRNGEGVVASFSCGLWCLFHIVSVGVPERHAAVLGHRHRVSTQHAAETFMDYIKHFFDWCPQCREQALQLYNSCAFNSCRRFRQRSNKSQKMPPAHTWQEFPVWMWQFHNDINEKLMAKEAHKVYGRKPSKVELQRARWPPRDACFLCLRDSGSWNQHHVYSYLKEEYWPAGVQNFRFVVLDKKAAEQKNRGYSEYFEHFYDLLYFITPRSQYGAFSAGAALIAIFASYVALTSTQKRLKMRKLRRTGRHKKYDVGPLFEVGA